MGKVLLLINSKNKYFWKFAEKSEKVEIEEVYKKVFSSKLYNKIRRRTPKWAYCYFGILNNWKYKLNSYDKIVILDSAYSRQIDFFLKSYRGKAYFFMWNVMHPDFELAENQMQLVYKGLKKYSYSRVDCKKHSIYFNTTMYIPKREYLKDSFLNKKEWTYDVIFIGLVIRNRVDQLDDILNVFSKQKISFYIYGVEDKKKEKRNVKPANYTLHDKYLSYEKYLKLLMESRAVLDVAKYDNEGDGISLRAMESIFYHKKFITTNPQVKEEKFYNRKNVFIIGEDDEDTLKDFIMEPYEDIPKEIEDYYLVENWVDRFE